MANIDQFIQYLDTPTSPDYWHEDGQFVAAHMLSSFDAESWKQLAAAWMMQSIDWQVKCAMSLEFAPLEHSIPLLLNMISISTNEEVIVHVADTLRSLRLKSIALPRQVVTHLQLIADQTTSRLHRKAIDAFIHIIASDDT